MKALKILGAVAVVTGVGFAAKKLFFTVDNLDFQLIKSEIDKGVKLKDLIVSPLTVRFKYNCVVRIKNPSKHQITFTKPYAKLLYNGTVVGSSTEISSDELNLPADGFIDVPVTLEMMSSDILSVSPDFISYMKNKLTGQQQSPKKFTIRILTRVSGIQLDPVDIDFNV